MQVAQAHETVQGGAEKDILETAKDISSARASLGIFPGGGARGGQIFLGFSLGRGSSTLRHKQIFS